MVGGILGGSENAKIRQNYIHTKKAFEAFSTHETFFPLFFTYRWHDDIANEERYLDRRGNTVLYFRDSSGNRRDPPVGFYPSGY